MNKRPTPETDAFISVGLENADRECVPAEFAQKLERERDEEREQLRKASVEANTLATSIQKAEYPDAKEFELLGSVAGVISQIDNMYAGVRQQRDEERQQYDDLAIEHILAVNKICNERDEALNAIHTYRCEVEAWELLSEARRERDEARDQSQRLRVQLNHYTQANEMAEQAFSERNKAREEIENVKLQLRLWEDGNLICEETLGEIRLLEERIEEALKELSSIHQWIDRNHPDGFIDSLTYFQNLERVTDNWYDRLDRLEVDAKRFVRERDEAREALKALSPLTHHDCSFYKDIMGNCIICKNKETK